jgi:hypothetical protein
MKRDLNCCDPMGSSLYLVLQGRLCCTGCVFELLLILQDFGLDQASNIWVSVISTSQHLLIFIYCLIDSHFTHEYGVLLDRVTDSSNLQMNE